MDSTTNNTTTVGKLRRRLRTRTTHRTYSYGAAQRIIDTRQGRATARTSSCEDINETPLVQRLRWTYTESADWVFTRTQVVNHAAIISLEQNVQQLKDLQDRVTALQDELAARPGPVLTARGDGETHLSESAIMTRRRREDDAGKALVLSRLAQARAAGEVARSDCRAGAAMLLEQYDLVCAAEAKLRAYTHRRGANYARAWDALREEPANRVAIPAPDWAGGRCPWLPPNYEQVLAGAPKPNKPGEPE